MHLIGRGTMGNFIKDKEYVDKKSVILTKEGIKITLEIYKGFYSLEEALEFIDKEDLDIKLLSFVKFLSMYYLIMFESNEEKAIIGKEVNWQSKNHYLEAKSNSRFKLNYRSTTLEYRDFNPQIYEDLRLIDKDIKIIAFREGSQENMINVKKYCSEHQGSGGFFEDISEHSYGHTFAVLLGLTFYSSFYNGNIANIIIDKYFSSNYITDEPYAIYKMPHTVVLGINPFKGEQLLDDGTVKKKRFYDPNKNNNRRIARHRFY